MTQDTPSPEEAPQKQQANHPWRLLAAMLAGGVIASAAGFAGALYLFFDPQQATLIADMKQQQDALKVQIEAQQNHLAQNRADNSQKIQEFESALMSLKQAQTDIKGRIDMLEARPLVTIDGEQNTDIQAIIAQLDGRITRLENFTKAPLAPQRQDTTAQRALAQMTAALEAGIPYAGALDALRTQLNIAIPQALSDPAQSGIVTLGVLQGAFDPIARDVLAQSRAQTQSGGVINFIKNQFEVRSLTPRAGTSTDAILSRTQGHLQKGALQAALDELEILPAFELPPLKQWKADATARIAALSALEQLALQLGKER